jgi:hypothetical protein
MKFIFDDLALQAYTPVILVISNVASKNCYTGFFMSAICLSVTYGIAPRKLKFLKKSVWDPGPRSRGFGP